MSRERFFSRSTRCAVLGVLVGLAATARAGSDAIVLSPADARGGVTAVAANGVEAVSLPPSTPPSGGYSWTLPEALGQGWWDVAVAFAPMPGDSTRMRFVMDSPRRALLDLNETRPAREEGMRVRYWCGDRVAAVSVSPQRTMKEPVRAISEVRLSRSAGAAGPETFWLIDLPVESGTTELPDGLPAGSWQISPKRPEGGKPWSGQVGLVCADGARMTQPLTGLVSYYAPSAPRSLEWTGAAPQLVGVVLRHAPETPDIAAPANGAGVPLPVADEKRLVRTTLTLAFSSGADMRALPEPALFPGGATKAVVTSWDDSPFVSDLRMAELLKKHGLKGTFFAVGAALKRPDYLSAIERLGMEIGSHTLTHPRAWLTEPERWARECLQMRTDLERLTGHPVISFAYPFNYIRADDTRGDYVLRGVRAAGYLSARTTMTGTVGIDSGADPLVLTTEGHFSTPRNKLDAAWAQAKPGGIFHLWGHTWEIRGDDKWAEVESLLAHYADRPSTWYATQGQVFLWKWLRGRIHWERDRQAGGVVEVTLVRPSLDPFWQERIPVTIALPPGVVRVTLADGRELPVRDGFVTLPQ